MNPKIHPDTLLFFQELNENNNREWFADNKSRWEAIRDDFAVFTEALIAAMVPQDDTLKGLSAKKCIYRIYRDIRFSADKRPYKTHISCFLPSGGRRNCGVPGYYLQIGQADYGLNDGCSVGGGIFMPEPAALNAIRQEIYYNIGEFDALRHEPDYRRYFGDEFFTIKKLQRVPKGYPADWEYADLLKYKDYTVNHDIEAEHVFDDDFLDEVLRVFEASIPLNKFIQRAMWCG